MVQRAFVCKCGVGEVLSCQAPTGYCEEKVLDFYLRHYGEGHDPRETTLEAVAPMPMNLAGDHRESFRSRSA